MAVTLAIFSIKRWPFRTPKTANIWLTVRDFSIVFEVVLWATDPFLIS